MTHIAVNLISQLTHITDAERESIEQLIPICSMNKGDYLLRAGQVAKAGYYVIHGCIREYELIDGQEKTTAFYIENQSANNFLSQTNQTPSKVNFVCEEQTTVAVLSSEKENELYKRHPRFESFCRAGMEQMMGQKHEEITDYIVLNPEQRYKKLLLERPELIQRVAQHQIASYLGIKPQSLSRIRARINEKE